MGAGPATSLDRTLIATKRTPAPFWGDLGFGAETPAFSLVVTLPLIRVAMGQLPVSDPL